MKVVLIDHNDSFTYNIVELLQKFKEVKVQVINYQNLDTQKLINFDKIILSPGPGLPKNYPKTTEVIKQFHQTKSILGICLGHQLISEFFGMQLFNLQEVKHGVKEQIIVNNQSVLYQNFTPNIDVGLYHSWAVKNEKTKTNLLVTATNNDGVIMSVQHQKLPVFGVQFHLESFLTPKGKNIMKNFLYHV